MPDIDGQAFSEAPCKDNIPPAQEPKGAVIKYDWEGGGRNLNFSAKYFIPH